MSVTVTLCAIVGKDGKMKTKATKTYHCEFCRSFIRNIDEEEDAASAAAA
jgi:hypothetical protein